MGMTIASFIRSSRELHGWTQTRLARETHVTRSTVARWESGRIRPPLRSLALLRLALAWDDEQWSRALTLAAR